VYNLLFVKKSEFCQSEEIFIKKLLRSGKYCSESVPPAEVILWQIAKKGIHMKYGDVTMGQIEAAINKLGGLSGWRALLRDELEIKPKPLLFPKNEHGHYLVEVTGRALTGAAEIQLQSEQNFRVGDYARQCFLSTNPDSYDAKHRLEDGKIYRLAIVHGREVKMNRTTANLRAYAQQFGYQKPLAGHIPRIRESVTDQQMEQMNIWYIAGLHDPIADSVGVPDVLVAYRGGGGSWLDAAWGRPALGWDDRGAFAFVVPN